VARVRPVDFSTKLTRTSTFDLSAFDPGLGFMLGLGGRDDFLTQEGESARGATETRSATVATGAELPLGFSATVSYSLTRTDRFQQVASGFTETISRQREWPVGSVRWTHTFSGGPITLVSTSAGLRHREGTSTQPSGGREGARSGTSSSSFTPDLQLSFRNGLGLTAAYSTRSQRTENNGNATLLDQDDVTGTLNYSFVLPASLSRIRKRVRSNLTAGLIQNSDLPRAGHQHRLYCRLGRSPAGNSWRARYRSTENRDRGLSVRLFDQRCSSSQSPDLTDLPAVVVPAFAVRGRLPVEDRRRRRGRSGEDRGPH
jgi:hypothetical protein